MENENEQPEIIEEVEIEEDLEPQQQVNNFWDDVGINFRSIFDDAGKGLDFLI